VVFRVAGGAPLAVSSWAPFGGPQPVTMLTPSQFAALNPYPSAGTFLVTSTGRIFTVAGGAPLPVSSWAVFGGVQPYVLIDEWDIDNISDPLAHLRSQPANGTRVQGLPSHTYWRFAPGGRVPIAPTALATPVDDTSLYAYALLPSAAPACVVPSLRHLTIKRAGGALVGAHCRLGRVRRPRHVPRRHVLRVVAQTPRPRVRHSAGYKVGIWVR
jgi:hypothetical protein